MSCQMKYTIYVIIKKHEIIKSWEQLWWTKMDEIKELPNKCPKRKNLLKRQTTVQKAQKGGCPQMHGGCPLYKWM